MPLGLPPDPFEPDPVDSVRLLAPQELPQPLTDQEKVAVETDLANLSRYMTLLSPRGIRGLVLWYDDCQQDHYYDWDMLQDHLIHLLTNSPSSPHEPAYDPQPCQYATWEYCRGYSDAIDHH